MLIALYPFCCFCLKGFGTIYLYHLSLLDYIVLLYFILFINKLTQFTGYYTKSKRSLECSFIKEITVVWSDPEVPPPAELVNKYSHSHVQSQLPLAKSSNGELDGAIAYGNVGGLTGSIRVRFEQYPENSLNNRFMPLEVSRDSPLLHRTC